jgi:hypothetical protein
MKAKILKFIARLLFNAYMMCNTSLRELNEKQWKKLQEEEFNSLKFAVYMHMWETAHGIPNSHTLEQIARTYQRKVEEVRLLVSIMEYEHTLYAEREIPII